MSQSGQKELTADSRKVLDNLETFAAQKKNKQQNNKDHDPQNVCEVTIEILYPSPLLLRCIALLDPRVGAGVGLLALTFQFRGYKVMRRWYFDILGGTVGNVYSQIKSQA